MGIRRVAWILVIWVLYNNIGGHYIIASRPSDERVNNKGTFLVWNIPRPDIMRYNVGQCVESISTQLYNIIVIFSTKSDRSVWRIQFNYVDFAPHTIKKVRISVVFFNWPCFIFGGKFPEPQPSLSKQSKVISQFVGFIDLNSSWHICSCFMQATWLMDFELLMFPVKYILWGHS